MKYLRLPRTSSLIDLWGTRNIGNVGYSMFNVLIFLSDFWESLHIGHMWRFWVMGRKKEREREDEKWNSGISFESVEKIWERLGVFMIVWWLPFDFSRTLQGTKKWDWEETRWFNEWRYYWSCFNDRRWKRIVNCERSKAIILAGGCF